MLKDYFGTPLAAGQKALLIGRRGSVIEKALKVIERVGLETVSVKDVTSGRRSTVTVTDNLVVHPDYIAREAAMIPVMNAGKATFANDNDPRPGEEQGPGLQVGGNFVNTGFHAI